MSAFEHLAVFLSLIFGLATTHLLAGIARSAHRRNLERLDDVQLVWALVLLMVIMVDWWNFFAWSTRPQWSIGPYAVLVLWSISHYLMAVTLYEPDSNPTDGANRMWDENRVWFLATFAILLILDILQTALRGALLRPIWYLPYHLHYFALVLVALVFESRTVQRWIGWYVLLSAIVWIALVRRLLADN